MRQEFYGVVGEITTLPGNSQIAVSHSVYLPPQLRGKGWGRKAHDARLKEAKRLGYQLLLCTVVVDNEPQIKLLREFGWSLCAGFCSKKTGNDVQLWSYHL